MEKKNHTNLSSTDKPTSFEALINAFDILLDEYHTGNKPDYSLYSTAGMSTNTQSYVYGSDEYKKYAESERRAYAQLNGIKYEWASSLTHEHALRIPGFMKWIALFDKNRSLRGFVSMFNLPDHELKKFREMQAKVAESNDYEALSRIEKDVLQLKEAADGKLWRVLFMTHSESETHRCLMKVLQDRSAINTKAKYVSAFFLCALLQTEFFLSNDLSAIDIDEPFSNIKTIDSILDTIWFSLLISVI